MRILITVIALFGLLACNEKNQQNEKVAESIHDAVTTRSNDSFIETDRFGTKDSLPEFSYDRKLYDEYFPSEVKTFLHDSLSEWIVPNPDEWDNLWFQSYKNPNTLVNYISGDFNCDQKRDFALLLSDKSKTISAWVIQSGKFGFTKIKLEDFGVFENHIQIGLSLIEPGNLDYIDPEKDEILKPIKLKCQAIQVEYFETAATTYYWDKNKYNSVVTGD